MDPMEQFRKVVADPGAYAKEWKAASGGKVVGTFCSYTPIEIINAADALSYRVLATGSDFTLADVHLQAYCCSLVRGILNDGLAGRLAFLDGAVFPHTCDSMQRLSDIWRMNTDFSFHEDLVLPVKLNTLPAQEYIAGVMDAFRRNMEKHLDAVITEEKLHIAIRKTNRVRDMLKRLERLRLEYDNMLDSSDLYTAAYAAMIMAPGEWLTAAEALFEALKMRSTLTAKASRKAILLSGGVCGSRNIHERIEKQGGMVVHDDMCTGARFFEGIVEEHNNPSAALARRYLQRMNCPAKHGGLYSRGEHLVNTARIKKADGVIFLLLKFCDPHAFDYPYLKKMLDDAGIPSILIEAENQFALDEQIGNRVDAFMEML